MGFVFILVNNFPITAQPLVFYNYIPNIKGVLLMSLYHNKLGSFSAIIINMLYENTHKPH